MRQLTALQNMMIQINDDGSEATFKYIDTISDALARLRKRDVFYKALKKLGITQG